MQRVTGIGGIFLQSKKDHKKLLGWYDRHLGIKDDAAHNGIFWKWRHADNPVAIGETVFSIFSSGSDYLQPSPSGYMINFRVADLDWLLEQLRAEGVEILGNTEVYEYGKFAWIRDPEGNKIELWEPAPGYHFDGGMSAS
ncbi:MAG TPA: glyoxalase [Bacteroidetes bacterium]|jgi:uncharacterized glyoxalase superfamily protein PhnB|nr:MAG: hypothetical protein ABR95_00670 [Sphingobacteriales bacterium BACL12 MAG-120813-bin55]HCK20873.1 glyoxalase [Bacteroidota bacterium]